MKNLILAALLISSTLQANETCKNIHDLSRTIMKNRQAGVEITRMYEVVEGFPEYKKMATIIVNDAYRIPHYKLKDYRQRAIKEFSEEWFLACLDELGS